MVILFEFFTFNIIVCKRYCVFLCGDYICFVCGDYLCLCVATICFLCGDNICCMCGDKGWAKGRRQCKAVQKRCIKVYKSAARTAVYFSALLWPAFQFYALPKGVYAKNFTSSLDLGSFYGNYDSDVANVRGGKGGGGGGKGRKGRGGGGGRGPFFPIRGRGVASAPNNPSHVLFVS